MDTIQWVNPLNSISDMNSLYPTIRVRVFSDPWVYTPYLQSHYPIIKGDTSPRDEGTHPRLKVRYFTLTFWRHPWDSLSHLPAKKDEGRVARGKDVGEEDLSKPFKEKLKTPLTRRIIEFAGPEYVMPANITMYDGSTDPADHLNHFSMAANSREWPMPVWCQMFQQTLDGGARGWFESLPLNSINEWYQLREAFTNRYSIRRACYKEPHEITKVVRRANETLPAFKERWTVETGLIMGVPEVMKISSFMDSVKSPELAKRFSSNIPKTVDEMMRRVDEFVRAEEAYARTELPPGESRDIHRRLSFPIGPREVHQR
ncbi:hypothetical protein Tco_0928700, partial [Tanacetum coccineum]